MSQENRPGTQESLKGKHLGQEEVCCGHRVQVRRTPLHPECGLDVETDGPKPTKRL